MADFSPNYTSRLIVSYRAGTRPHKMSVRYDTPTEPPSGFITGLNAFLALMNAFLPPDTALQKAEYIPQSGNIALPVTTGTVVMTGGDTTANEGTDRAAFLSITGKSTAGHKARIMLYGISYGPDVSAAHGDFRLSGADYGDIDDIIDALDAIPGLCGPDNLPVIWNRYINLGYSAYWQRKLRG